MKLKSFFCPFCEVVIYGTYCYRNHIDTYHVKLGNYICEICQKEFKKREPYRIHLTTHKDIEFRKHFICNECGRKFIDKRSLIVHLSSHGSIDVNRKRYKCTGCGEQYCEERLLKYHIRRNHFNLDYKEPNYYRKKINDIWIEKVKHMKVFVEITKVTDNILKIKRLDANFKNNNFKIVENSYNACKPSFDLQLKDQYAKGTCDYCNKHMLKKSLRVHIKEKHMNLRKFRCEVCKYTFKRQYQLSQHICGKFRPKSKENWRKKDKK